MEKKMILTLDYELFGNGSGDVFKHIIEPTDKILSICRDYHARITIFFEIIEYWKLKAEWDKGNNMGYKSNPIEAMERQLQKAYQEGHDVQLHLHPQWVNARWENERWIVDESEWRLGGFRSETPMELYNIIKKGKETIEEIIRPVLKDYHCKVMRAGGYNIQPSNQIVDVMKSIDMMADSSIVPGSREMGELSRYDYSSVPLNKGMYECGECLEQEGENCIFEIPIFSLPIIRWRKYLSLEKILSILNNRSSAKQTYLAKTSGDKKKTSMMHFLFEKEYQTWDFCLFSKSLHRHYIRAAMNQEDRVVFTLIGHPKSFVNGRGLKYLLKKTCQSFQYCICSEITEQ